MVYSILKFTTHKLLLFSFFDAFITHKDLHFMSQIEKKIYTKLLC